MLLLNKKNIYINNFLKNWLVVGNRESGNPEIHPQFMDIWQVEPAKR